MPILPLSHPEPFAAVLGVMLHPREKDQAKAEAFAFQYLGVPLEEFHRRGGELPRSDLKRIAESGRLLTDLDSEKRWYQATAAGQILKTYFGLCNTDPGLATLENAIKIAERVAGQHGKSGSRSSLQDCWSQYRSVAHLWGAWVLRDRRFMEKPEAGYDYATDFQAFLQESEDLRYWGETWTHSRAKAEPPLQGDNWRVPEDWRAPQRQEGWPDTGKIAMYQIPDEYMSELKPAGRPRKKDK